MRSVLGVLCVLLTAHAISWQPISCPKPASGIPFVSCDYDNTDSDDDVVVSIFFQYDESAQTASQFQCVDTAEQAIVYCKRSWGITRVGSVGLCYFILPQGRNYTCSGSGTVNILDTESAHLDGKWLINAPVPLTCPSVDGEPCSFQNDGPSDMYVVSSFEISAAAGPGGGACSVDGNTICSYATGSNSEYSYSCPYFLPSGSTLVCNSTAATNGTSAAWKFNTTRPSVGSLPLLKNTTQCLKPNYPNSTLCDCSVVNPFADQDLIVAASSTSADGQFFSFHCDISGTNACAFGTNNDNTGDIGSCYVLLPAGATLNCQMEWGASSFTSSVVAVMNTTLFPNPSRSDGPSRAISPRPVAARDPSLESAFSAWMLRHNKTYTSDLERSVRLTNFLRFHSLSRNLNQRDPSRYNHLADLSSEEFEASYRHCARKSHSLDQLTIPPVRMEDVPEAFDWRDKGAVTAVKDQGQCGSCWSFSTTGALERMLWKQPRLAIAAYPREPCTRGAWAIAGHDLESLSEQTLVSCDNGNDGCNGGWPTKAIDYVAYNGIDTEKSYPYSSGQGKVSACDRSSGIRAAVTASGHRVLNVTEESLRAALVNTGPLSILVDAMTQLWWPYSGGVMSGCCNHEIDHAVLLVGFGTDNGVDYWTVKNSWGSSWGEQGYIRLARGTNECGILTETVAAIIGTPPPPPPPPSPCPSDATEINTTTVTHCLWINGTKSFIMAPAAEEYCDYISQGYLGISWDKKEGGFDQYPCPPSAEQSESPDSFFCLIRNGDKGVRFPKSVKADCGEIGTKHQFGYTYPR